MKQYKEWLFVDELPNKFIQKDDIWINNVNCIRYTEFHHHGKEFPQAKSSKAIQLPPGQWQIVGRAKDLTEEQWGEIVDWHSLNIGTRPAKKNYENGMFVFATRRSSGRSLLKSLSLDENCLVLKQVTNG